MADHQIGPGAFVTNVSFKDPKFDSTAATPRADTTSKEPLDWKVVTGAIPGGNPAMSASFSFVPKGVPKGFMFGVKQIAFTKGETITYQGLEKGSIVAGSTGVNFTWLLDCTALISSTIFKADFFPFFSANPIAVANESQGRIDLNDSPGGSERLIRLNLVTSKRNFLRSHVRTDNFVTFLVVVKPDSTILALEGFAWTFELKAEVDWLGGKPTVSASGNASFQNTLRREDIKGDRLTVLESNSLVPNDIIGFKINNAKILIEERDAATLPGKSGGKDVIFSEAGYQVTHSAESLPRPPIR